eukprot:g33209.t1
MVVVGGLTRLTKSGLSMVEWKPAGGLPPMNEQEWEQEFHKYKQYPEYQRQNQDMTLSEFKYIFYWEWGHRMLGRSIGVAFALPLCYFAIRGRINASLGKRLIGLFALGGAQGAVGWWMVKSGLEAERFPVEQQKRVSVSPYRLATHLCSAFVIYSALLTTALQCYTGPLTSCAPPGLRRSVLGTCAIVAATVFSGAFVAGNQAGLCYNEYPLMGGRWIPQDIVDPKLQPSWRNLFENSTTVQFDHRLLGSSTVVATSLLWHSLRRTAGLHAAVYKWGNAMGAMGILQVSMGIATLLLYVPIPLAACHQAGSLALLSLCLGLLHSLGPAKAVTSSVHMGRATAAVALPLIVVPVSEARDLSASLSSSSSSSSSS